MGSRDLSGGALFLSASSMLAIIIACFIPVWWFTTIELKGQMCSCGTGFWTSNYTWGDDITEENYYSTLVCDSSNPLATIRCDADWVHQEETRKRGKQAGIVSIIAICFLFLTCGFAWRLVPGYGDPINAKRAFYCSSTALALQLFAHIWFHNSPLFYDLSYYFSCQFEFVHVLNSNSLICHALGPGWALSAVGCIFTMVATILYYFAYNPTGYIDPSTGRYSLFTELFDRKLDRQRIIMALDETEPPVDDSSAARRFIRAYGIPLLCMANLSLFLYSNLSTGATVEPHVRIVFPHWIAVIMKSLGIPLKDGSVLEFREDVFNFTLVSSLRHFWSSRAYALGVLIGVFSGIWPYAKVFGMLMLWFIPASERVRGRALHWIDLLGKWSLIDSFFLCLMCVGFGFDTTVNIIGIDLSVKISVRPGWGVYSFVIATIWSLILSHYLTHVHRRAVERRTWTNAYLKSMKGPPFESLGSRPYAPLIRHRRFKCRSSGRLFVWILLCGAFVIAIGGQIAKSFKFTFGGLAQLILSPEKQVTEYSMVSIGLAIPAAAREGGYLSGKGWNWFLAIQFFGLAMVIPLIRILLLMVLWSVPMTLRTTKRLHHAAEVIAAWSAMDVFLVAIIAAVMEIGQLSSEVLSSGFGPIESTVCQVIQEVPPKILDMLLHLIGLPSLDLSKGCSLFRVDAELHGGCWTLLAAVLVCEIVAHIIVELCEASIAERMAMLSAYHRANYPNRSPRRRTGLRRGLSQFFQAVAPTRPSENLETPLTSDFQSNRHLVRLLNAQEAGARNFVGSWFDFLYGPFPRTMWVGLVNVGLVKRVAWAEIGQDLREDLVVDSDHEGDNSASSTPLISAASMDPSAEITVQRANSGALLNDLLRFHETENDWTAASPLINHHQ